MMRCVERCVEKKLHTDKQPYLDPSEFPRKSKKKKE